MHLTPRVALCVRACIGFAVVCACECRNSCSEVSKELEETYDSREAEMRGEVVALEDEIVALRRSVRPAPTRHQGLEWMLETPIGGHPAPAALSVLILLPVCVMCRFRSCNSRKRPPARHVQPCPLSTPPHP